MKPNWESLNPQNQLQCLFLNYPCPPESSKEVDDALSSLRVDLRRCGGNSGKATNADGWVPRGQSLQDSSAPPHSSGSSPVCHFPSRKQSPSRVKVVLKLSSWKSEYPSGGSIKPHTVSLPWVLFHFGPSCSFTGPPTGVKTPALITFVSVSHGWVSWARSSGKAQRQNI